MSAERYPLEAARTLREQELEDAKSELGGRSAALADAEAAVTRAEAELARHDEETARIAAREHVRDDAGRSAADMLAAQAYLSRRAAERQAHRDRIGDAKHAAAEAAEAVVAARAALAAARAAREAVEKHYEAWLRERRLTAERRAEAEADDLNRRR
jgi:flagellar biosynthesis chaperone FliJ